MTYNVCLPLTDFNLIIFTDFTSDELYCLYLQMIFFYATKDELKFHVNLMAGRHVKANIKSTSASIFKVLGYVQILT